MHASTCAPDWGPAEHHARDACCSHGEWQVAPDCPTQAPRCARDECCSLEKQRSLSNQLPRSSLFIEIEIPWQSPGKSWSASDGTWQTSFHLFTSQEPTLEPIVLAIGNQHWLHARTGWNQVEPTLEPIVLAIESQHWLHVCRGWNQVGPSGTNSGTNHFRDRRPALATCVQKLEPSGTKGGTKPFANLCCQNHLPAPASNYNTI